MRKDCFLICAIVLLCLFFAFRKGKEWYYVNIVGLGGNTVKIQNSEPVSVFLPVGYVLLFVDKRDQFGYMYFSSSKYGKAEYIFGLYINGRRTEQKGCFTIWRSWPFEKRKGDDAVYGDGTSVPYFSWIENGWLDFAFGKIDRVSVIELSEWESSLFSTNKVEWIRVGEPTI